MSGFSSGSYGYDEFATDFSYEDEQNYTKPVKALSFQDRVNAKRNALNGARLPKQQARISADDCQCRECAPELYKQEEKKPVKDNKIVESPKVEVSEKNSNTFRIEFDKDTIFVIFIILLCVLSIVMYFKIKKLSQRLKQLIPKPVQQPQI